MHTALRYTTRQKQHPIVLFSDSTHLRRPCDDSSKRTTQTPHVRHRSKQRERRWKCDSRHCNQKLTKTRVLLKSGTCTTMTSWCAPHQSLRLATWFMWTDHHCPRRQHRPRKQCQTRRRTTFFHAQPSLSMSLQVACIQSQLKKTASKIVSQAKEPRTTLAPYV